MNFITNFSFNKRLNNVYNFVLVIINHYIKMNILYFCHEENHYDWINEYQVRSCDAQIRRVKRRCLEQRIRLYERILNRHLLSHEDEKTTEHRLLFANRRSNRTLKSEFETFFTNVLLRKTDRMNKILVSDWIRLSK
jgi:hypothetical protein